MSMLLAATQAIRYGSRKSLSRLEDTEDYTSMSSSDEFQSPFHSLKKVMDTTSRAIDDAGLAGASPLKIKINLPTTVNYSIKAFKNDLKESLTQSHKDIVHSGDMCDPDESSYTMKIVDAPTSIFVRTHARFNHSRVQVHLRHTEMIIKDHTRVPLLTLNYTQISKWTVCKNESRITLHYTKSHYKGVFKTISLRTHTKKDTSALDSFIAILEHHVARLVVHKGIAHDVTAALSLFEQSRKSNRVKEREAEERELRSPTTA